MKKTLALILAALMLFTLAACSSEKEEDRLNIKPSHAETENDNGNGGDFDFSDLFGNGETEEDYGDGYVETEAETEAAPKTYENRYIKIYGDGDKHKGNIEAIYGIDASILQTKDGKLYNSPYSEKHMRDLPDVEVLKTYVRGHKSIYECANGYTYINWTPCRDFVGEILCTIGEVNVISHKDGRLYFTGYEETGEIWNPSEPMFVMEYYHNEKIEQIDSAEVYDNGGRLFFVVKSGDRTFFGSPSMLLSHWEGGRYITLYELNQDHYKIFDYGYSDGATSPLYSKSDDATVLNYTEGAEGEREYAVNLPEGYTAADVKQAIFGDEILIQFNDGSVYLAYLKTTVVGINLSLDENLTKISKEGHVNKFYMNKGNVLMHCDDDVIYYYEL